MKKLLALFLALTLLIGLSGCSDLALLGLDIATDVLLEESESTDEFDRNETEPQFSEPEDAEIPESTEESDADSCSEPLIDEFGWYYSKEDVSLYIYTYGHLPENFITKDEARDMGWEGGSVEKYAPGYAIGGDTFGNREGLLPKEKGRIYYECDIDTNGASGRGAKRIVFSNDGLIYYTDDHYESFTLLYGEE